MAALTIMAEIEKQNIDNKPNMIPLVLFGWFVCVPQVVITTPANSIDAPIYCSNVSYSPKNSNDNIIVKTCPKRKNMTCTFAPKS